MLKTNVSSNVHATTQQFSGIGNNVTNFHFLLFYELSYLASFDSDLDLESMTSSTHFDSFDVG
jgi:hypothetical protein